jgi:hypothetical protein
VRTPAEAGHERELERNVMTSLFTPSLVALVLVAVLGLGSVVSIAIVTALARKGGCDSGEQRCCAPAARPAGIRYVYPIAGISVLMEVKPF